MITINLSEEQARELLKSVGWSTKIPQKLEAEIFTQLENALIAKTTSAAEIAVWKAKHVTPMKVTAWKRKNFEPIITDSTI